MKLLYVFKERAHIFELVSYPVIIRQQTSCV